MIQIWGQSVVGVTVEVQPARPAVEYSSRTGQKYDLAWFKLTNNQIKMNYSYSSVDVVSRIRSFGPFIF